MNFFGCHGAIFKDTPKLLEKNSRLDSPHDSSTTTNPFHFESSWRELNGPESGEAFAIPFFWDPCLLAFKRILRGTLDLLIQGNINIFFFDPKGNIFFWKDSIWNIFRCDDHTFLTSINRWLMIKLQPAQKQVVFPTGVALICLHWYLWQL